MTFNPVSATTRQFLEIGKKALAKAVDQARPHRSVYHISRAMQQVVEKAGYSAVYQLTGHGIGRQLHQPPNVPCVAQKRDRQLQLYPGETLAIEIMYAAGQAQLVIDPDGWTYRTADGSLAGMFEETVLVTDQDPEVLT